MNPAERVWVLTTREKVQGGDLEFDIDAFTNLVSTANTAMRLGHGISYAQADWSNLKKMQEIAKKVAKS